MFNRRYVTFFTLVVIVARNVNCFRIKRNTFSDVFDPNSIEALSTKLIDRIERSRIIRLNDFLSIETIHNATNEVREDARLLDKLEKIANTKSLNANLGLVDLKLFRDNGEVKVDVKLDPRKFKGGKGGSMLLPLLIGIKATTFIFAAVSLVGLFTLKAFIASKTAILIAIILGLKKLFGGNHKTISYDAVHEHYPIPEYQYADFRYEPEIFKGHAEIPDHKLVEMYELSNDQNELPHEQGQEVSTETLKGQDFHGMFGSNPPEFKHESHQRRRNWKNNGKRKPLSPIIGVPHHEPSALTYRKVVNRKSS